MEWDISFSKQALSFIKKNHLSEEVLTLVKLAIGNFQGERVSVDVRKMKGEWKGFYRIRKGKYRIVASFDFDKSSVFVEVVDWRGNIY